MVGRLMLSTMTDYPLTTTMLFEHGRRTYPDSVVASFDGTATHRATFAEIGDRVDRLAVALMALGVQEGDRVATFCSNRQEHLELYFAAPGIGAVLHPLNIRLASAQTAYTIKHAEDTVLFVEGALLPLIAGILNELSTLKHVVVIGEGDTTGRHGARARLPGPARPRRPQGFTWPELNERAPAFMCYTSGTTGDPKGVVYDHRARVLHTYAVCSGAALAFNERDCVLVVVPMFHVLAWGMPFAAWMVGSNIVLPGSHLRPEHLVRLVEEQRVTCTAAVPTIFTDVMTYAESHEIDLSSLRIAWCGGSSVPASLREAFAVKFGVDIVEGWGMTETSAVSTLNYPPKGSSPAAHAQTRSAGRVMHGVEMRVVSTEGAVLVRDAAQVGEIEVRGPWVTGSYYLDDRSERFHDGWLRTGDVGTIDRHGYVRITDRLKDIIKSGGEWISSLELENALLEHPAVAEAAVIGVDDARFQERPLAFIVRSEDTDVSLDELCGFLKERVARWWVPDLWAVTDAIPRTTVGKTDKVELRRLHAAGDLDLVTTSAGDA